MYLIFIKLLMIKKLHHIYQHSCCSLFHPLFQHNSITPHSRIFGDIGCTVTYFCSDFSSIFILRLWIKGFETCMRYRCIYISAVLHVSHWGYFIIPVWNCSNKIKKEPRPYYGLYTIPIVPLVWLLVCDLNRTPIVMAKHGGPCVHFSGISTCGRTLRETLSHPLHPPLPTLCKISLPVYVIVTNERLQPLTATWYNSLVLSFSLLKI